MDPVPENFTINSGNASLNVSLYRRKGSETVILLHGGPGVPDEMTEVREWLTSHFQVIYFDQRGTGKFINDKCTFSLSEYVEDLLTVSERFGIEKFHLFGHSWGCIYAILFAKAFPEKVLSLFLCSPASGTGRIWKKAEHEIFLYNYMRSTLREWLVMSVDTILGMLGSRKAYLRLFRQIIINYHKGFNVPPPDDEKLLRIGSRAGVLTRNELRRHPELEPFSQTPFRVIITYGEFDAFTKSRHYLLNLFPFAQKLIIPSSGHTPWKHNLPAFHSILHSFYSLPPG